MPLDFIGFPGIFLQFMYEVRRQSSSLPSFYPKKPIPQKDGFFCFPPLHCLYVARAYKACKPNSFYFLLAVLNLLNLCGLGATA